MTTTAGILAENVDAIINAAGIELDESGRERFRNRLTIAEELYRIIVRQPVGPIEVLKGITKVKDRAEELLELLEGDRRDLPKLVLQVILEPLNQETQKAGFPVNTALQNLRADLPVIIDAAHNAAELLDSRRQKGRGGRRHRGTAPERELIATLVDTYTDISGRKPGLSKAQDTGKPTGPLLRYIQCCLQLLGIEKTDDAAYSLLRRILIEN